MGLLIMASGFLCLFVLGIPDQKPSSSKRKTKAKRRTQKRVNTSIRPRGVLLVVTGGTCLALLFLSQPMDPRRWFAIILAAGVVMAGGYFWSQGSPAASALDFGRQEENIYQDLCFWGGVFLMLWGTGHGLWITAAGFGISCISSGAGSVREETIPPRVAMTAVSIVVIAGLVFHLWDLSNIPQGMNIEELNTMAAAGPVIRGEKNGFYWATPGYAGVTLYHHVIGWIYRFLCLGDVWGLRLFSVLGWMILTFYGILTTKIIFGWTAAFGTAAYLCLSFVALHYGRFGFMFIWAPAALAGAFAHAVMALQGKHGNLHLILVGVWGGLSLYGWPTAWVIPGVVFAYLVGVLGFSMASWKDLKPGLLGCFAIGLALALPAVVTLVSQKYWNVFGGHSYGESSFYFQGTPFVAPTTLTENFKLYLVEILQSGNQRGMHYLPGLPLVPPGILFFVGSGLAILTRRTWKSPNFGIVALLLLSFVPAWFTMPQENIGGNFSRLVSLILPLGILFGAGWSLFVAFLSRVSSKLRVPWLPLAGLVVLVWPLWAETKHYFVDYRNHPKAILDHNGPTTALGRAFGEESKEKGPLSLSPSYVNFIKYMIPKEIRFEALRGGPDFARLMSLSPKGVLGYEVVYGDWGPWLSAQVPGIAIKFLPNPWPGISKGGDRGRFEDTKSLGVTISWKQGFSIKGLAQHPDRNSWRGTLWVPAPGPHRITTEDFAMKFAGRFDIPPRSTRDFWLHSVPYDIKISGGPRPEPKVWRISGERKQEIQTPIATWNPRHGLRKTLLSLRKETDFGPWVSLEPVISQRFHESSYGFERSPVGLPLQATWEGFIEVPRKGTYTFSVPNSCSGVLALWIDGLQKFKTIEGRTKQSEIVDLEAGQRYSIKIRAERIISNAGLRFLVSRQGQEPIPVPWTWLWPAPLPGPEPLDP